MFFEYFSNNYSDELTDCHLMLMKKMFSIKVTNSHSYICIFPLFLQRIFREIKLFNDLNTLNHSFDILK